MYHSLHAGDYWSSEESAEQYVAWTGSEYEEVADIILEYYTEVNPQWQKGESKIPLVLDIACGAGDMSAILSAHSDKVIGVDISQGQIALARRLNSRENVQYKVGPAQELSKHCPLHEVDLAFVYTAAPYFDCDQFYNEVRKCMKPNGVFIIMGQWSPGFQHEDERFKNYFGDFEITNAIDEITLRSNTLMSNSYHGLHFPFEGAIRRERIVHRQMNRKEVEELFLGVTALIKGGKKTIMDMLEGLPSQETSTMIRKLYGIFYKFPAIDI